MKILQTEVVDLLVGLGVDTAKGWDLPKLATKINGDGGITRYLDEGQEVKDPVHSALYERIKDAQFDGQLIEITGEADATPDDGTFPLTDGTDTEPESTAPPVAAPAPPAKKGKGKSSKPTVPKSAPVKVAAKKPVGKTKVTAVKTSPGRPKKDHGPLAPGPTLKKSFVPKPKPLPKKPSPKKKLAISTDPNLTWKQRLVAWKKKPYTLTTKGPGVVRTIVDLLERATEKKPITKTDVHNHLVTKFPDRDPLKMMRTVNNQIPTQLRQMRRIPVVSVPVGNRQVGYYIPSEHTRDATKSVGG